MTLCSIRVTRVHPCDTQSVPALSLPSPGRKLLQRPSGGADGGKIPTRNLTHSTLLLVPKRSIIYSSSDSSRLLASFSHSFH